MVAMRNTLRTSLMLVLPFLLGLAVMFYLNGGSVNEAKVESGKSDKSPYVGQEKRGIKSLSTEDIKALELGQGTAFDGMAKTAELSGYPGSKHVIEFGDKLSLSSAQEQEVKDLFESMKKEAIGLGKKIISVESEMSTKFDKKDQDKKSLDKLLSQSAELYGKLRLVHLSAHLDMMEILNEKQINKYITLRGYDIEDPCGKAPEGHDPKMWKKHNDCG